MTRQLLLSFALLIISSAAFSQQKTYLRGNIFGTSNDDPIPGASVTNLNNKRVTNSTPGGTYEIEAAKNDLIVFSFTGMTSDTVKVEEQLLISGYDVGLKIDPTMLKSVTVTTNYQLDSLRRAEENADVLKKPAGITGGNTPQAGAGIVLSPVSFFSKGAKEKRKLKKQLLKNEEEAYIDYVFSPGWVSRLTGLKGDSLHLFLYKYRPSYKQARSMDRPNMTVYVNDSYKEFKEGKK